MTRETVAAIQRRCWLTTVVIQRFQRVIHKNVVQPALAGEIDFNDVARLPLPLRLLNLVPRARRVPPYLLAYGAMRERPPAAVR